MKRFVRSSSLGQYVGRRLTNWTVNLLVYGAEESEFYDLERGFSGSLDQCIKKAKEYFDILESNGADGYVTLESDTGGEYFEFYDFYDVEDQFPEEVNR